MGRFRDSSCQTDLRNIFKKNSSPNGEIQDFDHDFAHTFTDTAKLEAIILFATVEAGQRFDCLKHILILPVYVHSTLLLTMTWIGSDLIYEYTGYRCHCSL